MLKIYRLNLSEKYRFTFNMDSNVCGNEMQSNYNFQRKKIGR